MELLSLNPSGSATPLPPAGAKGTEEGGRPPDVFALLFQALWADSVDLEADQAGLEQPGAATRNPAQRIDWLRQLDPAQLQQLAALLPQDGTALSPDIALEQVGEMLAAFLEGDAVEADAVPEASGELVALLAEWFQSADAGVDGMPEQPLDGQGTESSVPDEQREAVLAQLLEQLPPPVQERLQRWAAGGNELPPAEGPDGSGEKVGDAAPVLPWLQVARKLLGGREDAAGGLPTAPPAAEGDREGQDIPEGETLEFSKFPAGPGRTEALAVSGDGRPDPAQFPEVVRLRQLLGQVQETLGERPALPGAAPQVGGIQPTMSTVTQGAAPQFMSIPQPPGEPAWDRALGERVLWMAGRQVQHAEVRINPPQLGPVEIRVAIQNEQASVSFTAQHPFTREAIEAALPRLREMLADANLNLVNVDVGQRDTGGSRAQQGRGGGFPGGGAEPGGSDSPAPVTVPAAAMRSGVGLVDDFA